ncbi:hypothetical protein [Chryseobacterium sp. OSA05B]|uniref:hypothetical protein n=1 Tax=Chryseobacterium sp. OSA05B TaxID=2862650 RepID=UPI001CBCD61F|nr:hypothetical protein [Chryseobacterium sp. OSA05B]
METLELRDPVYGTEAVGNKLENLVSEKIGIFVPMAETDMDHDVGVMFKYQARKGVLKCFGNDEASKPYLDSYFVKIDILKTLHSKYKSIGKGIKFDFVFIDRLDYMNLTGQTGIPTTAGKLLYFIATPIDNSDNPANEHYVIFNLDHDFVLENDMIDGSILENLVGNYKAEKAFTDMAAYSHPVVPTYHVYYTWDDIHDIFTETNSKGQLYDSLKFIPGEVIEFAVIVQHFKDTGYDFAEDDYKEAYLKHEKRLTILGMYMPDDKKEKEGYFDMGSLYP